MRIELPFPPSVNHYWRHAVKCKKFARVYLTPEALEFRRKVKAIIGKVETITDKVEVTVTLHAHGNRRYDVDNFAKAVNDALTHADVWLDDYQIDKQTMIRGKPVKDGLCVVEINLINEV